MAGNRAKLFFDPACQIRCFVIKEHAAIPHRRRALHKLSGFHKKLVVMFGRHIRPVMPGRNADLLGQIVNAVNRPALVAAADNQRAGDARQRIGHDLNQERFPFAGDFRDVNFLFMDQPVNQRTFAEGADEDDVFPKFVFARESAGERPVTRSTAAFSASELRKKMLFARYLQAGDMAIWS